MDQDCLAASHRLRLGRRSVTGQTYAVTVCCHDRSDLFAEPSVRDAVGELIEEAVEHGFARLDAYVVMPDHMHLVFALGESKSLERALNDLKKIIARRVNDRLGRRGAVWQRGFFDHGLRSQADLERQVWYILGNPVRKGLAARVDEYPWARVGPWQANGDVNGVRAQGSAPTNDKDRCGET